MRDAPRPTPHPVLFVLAALLGRARPAAPPERARPGRRVVVTVLAAFLATALLGACSSDEGGGDADGPEETVLPYGDAGWQRGGLTLPEAGGDELPVVVLLHGGFWRSDVDRNAMDAVVESIVDEGWAAWNVEVRPSDDGGGWPETFEDVASAVDHVAEIAEARGLDPGRVVVLGHSGGGTLALWAAARAGLPDDSPGADPAVRPIGVASLAGIPHLVAGSEEGLADGAVDELMGGPPGYDPDDPYLVASPAEQLPLDVPVLVVAGEDDPLVPVRQSSAFAARAEAEGDQVTALILSGVDHNDVIDTRRDEWAQVLTWLHDQLDD